MRRPRYEIEAGVPPRQDPPETPGEPPNLRPRIRRQVERICESLGIQYDDLAELHIRAGVVDAIVFDRQDGKLYRNEGGQVATRGMRVAVDTSTPGFDERDF